MGIKSKAKKERIIDAAIKLWRETHNVQKVSLADIAREAGVSQTTVYNNFGTRDKLVEEVIKYLMRETMDKQWAIVRSDLPIPLKIQSIITTKSSTMQDIVTDVLAKLAEDASTRRYLNEMYEAEMKPMMNEIIDDGKRQGYIRPDLPNEAVMIYLDIVKEGGLANTEQLQRVVSDTQLMSGLTRLIYYGLFQKEFDFTIDFNKEKEKK
jgi:AcrR family transcriptional regulator